MVLSLTRLRLNEFAFPRDALVHFVHALDAIFELTVVLGELLGHRVDAARYVATEREPDGHNLTDLEFMERAWRDPPIVATCMWMAPSCDSSNNDHPTALRCRGAGAVHHTKSGHWLSLWRSSGEILNHGCKSLRSDFHRAGERMIDCHNGQQPGKD